MAGKESWKRTLLKILLEMERPYEGEVYENEFICSLEKLRTEGKIDGWKESGKDSKEDDAGIDFFIERAEWT